MVEVLVGASLMFVGIITGWVCCMVSVKERNTAEERPEYTTPYRGPFEKSTYTNKE